MEENKVNTAEPMYGGVELGTSKILPTKVSAWTKIKNFLFQEIDLFQEVDLNKPIVLELTPKEEKVLTEVHDFLFQEVKFPELHDFLFQEVTIFGKKNKK